jgi:hypothetical protein
MKGFRRRKILINPPENFLINAVLHNSCYHAIKPFGIWIFLLGMLPLMILARNGGSICVAYVVTVRKLQVEPCFLPKRSARPYRIDDYEEGDVEEEGRVLISGGQPKNVVNEGEDVNACDGSSPHCTTGHGVNNIGLCIFTRQKDPLQGLVEKVRTIAKENVFATSGNLI